MKKSILIKSVIGGLAGFILIEYFNISVFNWEFYVVMIVLNLIMNPILFIIIWDGIKQMNRELPSIIGSLFSSRRRS